MSDSQLTRDEVLHALKEIGQLPVTANRRMIYEVGIGEQLRPGGHFYIDYATFPGGTNKEVPRSVIAELEGEGLIIRAYPDTRINAWVLA